MNINVQIETEYHTMFMIFSGITMTKIISIWNIFNILYHFDLCLIFAFSLSTVINKSYLQEK